MIGLPCLYDKKTNHFLYTEIKHLGLFGRLWYVDNLCAVLLKVELHDREKRLLIAQESELQETVQSLQKELGMP